MSTELEVRIGNDYAELPKLIAAAEEFLQRHSVPESVAYKTHLALEEMCTNVIKYSYDDNDKHEILIHFTWTPGQVTLRIEDDGHEYNPLEQEEPDTSQPLAERKIGGLGIYLVRKSMNSMEYRREGNRNILVMGLTY